MFIGIYNKSIILTFIGLFFTIFGIKFSFDGNFVFALICLLLSGICDTFDGTIARMVKRDAKGKKYGVELDSLVDVVCFGVFPVVIGICFGFDSTIDLVIYCIYMFCGVTRLAYFNVDEDNNKYFKGLPITMSSFLLPIAFFIYSGEIFIMAIFLIMAFLFLLNFKLPKSSTKLKFVYLFIGIVIIALLLLKLWLV